MSNAIGEMKNAIATARQGVEDNLKEAKKIEKQAMEYKKEFETYKKLAEEKVEKAKEMKENAERLKALMEDPSALTGSLQDKFTSVAKSYGGDLGIPTSQEDIDALKGGLESKINQGKDLVNSGASVVGGKEVLSEDINIGEIKKADEKGQALTKDDLKEQKVAPELQTDNKFRRGSDTLGINELKSGVQQLNQGNKEAVATKLEGAEGLQKGMKDADIKTISKDSAVNLKSEAAVKKDGLTNLKSDIPVKKDLKTEAPVKVQPTLEKKPEQGFRKSAPVLRKESFFNRVTYDLSFAAAVSDHQKANTGKATSGDAIIPRDIAAYCGISVNDLKQDYELILRCLADIMDQEGEQRSTVDDIMNMRLQNATSARAIAMKMENNGAHQDEVVSDLDKKAETLSEGRNISGMAPTYNMEIAKIIKNYTFVRATRMAFEIFDDMKEYDYTDYKEEKLF